MKKLNILLFLLASIIVSAQPTLVFEKHTLKAGIDNPMTYCSFSEVGKSGGNISWDFTSLKSVKNFTGHISDALNSNFALANTELEEFGVRFFYDSKEDGIEQYGYLAKNGKTRVYYDSPYEKMRFPLSYKDSYFTPFSGEYFSDGKSIGQIQGDGQIDADAWGTISLPGNIKYENTLRVKSEKNYTITFEHSTQIVEMVTYRWYNSSHRYPLLVLIETSVVNANNLTRSTKAAYNLNAVKSASLDIKNTSLGNGFSIYPNPASNEFVIKLSSINDGFINISITDMSGREIVPPFAKGVFSGMNEILIKNEISNLREGLYILSVASDGKLITHELSISR